MKTASGLGTYLFATVSILARISAFGLGGGGRGSINHLFNPNTGVQCLTLDPPSNGRLKIAGPGGYGDVATYTCDTGFYLVGMSQHACHSDGTWSGSEPTCESKYV